MQSGNSIREIFDSSISKSYESIKGDHFSNISTADHSNTDDNPAFSNILVNDDEYYVLHRSVKFAATWLSIISVSVLGAISSLDEGDEPRVEQVAALAFFSRLSNDLWAIIDLCERGFDLQARALARSYLEHVDVLICCIHDIRITRDFVKSVEPEDANQFWHRNVSRNKSKKLMQKIVSSIADIDDSGLVDLLREDADRYGSAIIHPSVASGLVSAFGSPEEEYQSYPIFPVPIPESAGVFRVIMTHLFWLWFAMGSLPLKRNGAWPALIRDDQLSDKAAFIRLSLLYSEMFGFLLDNDLMMKAAEEDELS